METLYQSVAKYKDELSPAIYFENKEISFREMNFNIRKMVTYLQEHNVKKGDVVTIVLPNIPVMVYLFYAIDAIGAISNIVHPLTPFDAIIDNMNSVDSHIAVLTETIYGENKERIEQLPYIFFFANPLYEKSFIARQSVYLKYKKVKESNHIFAIDKFKGCNPVFAVDIRDPEETSIYLHSGGTTSLPKTIALSDRALNNLAKKTDYILDGKSIFGKSMLAVLPCFHGFGLGMGVHAPLCNGGTTALMIKFNPDKVIKWINENKVNYIIGVPQLYRKLLKNKHLPKADLKNLELCFIGGDNVDKNLILEFNQFMKEHNSKAVLLEGYGLTETVTVAAVNTYNNNKIGSVGKPLKDIEISIRDDNMKLLMADEVGEVYISGDTSMNEYLNEKEATLNTIIEIDGKKWVRTLDLGYLDKDGYLYLKGRKKRLIKISGVNVYPAEIENSLSQIEGVEQTAMVAFNKPKQHIILYVLKSKDFMRDKCDIVDEINDTIKSQFFKYCLPEKIVFMDKFPYTKVGKIDYNAFMDPVETR